jgi:type IV pilus assembly protein PilM
LTPEELKKQIQNYIKRNMSVGPRDPIGLDIGSHSLKIAEVKKTKDGYFIDKFTTENLPEASLIEDEFQKFDEIALAIGKSIKKVNIKSKMMCVGLFGPNISLRRIQLPGGSAAEIDEQVQWEAEQYIPFQMEECNISYHLFGDNPGGGVDILLVAAKKTTLSSFTSLLEKNQLFAKVYDLNVVALINYFEFLKKTELAPDISYIVLNIGSQKTDFVIYRNNSIIFSKEINIGGVNVTEEIQRQIGVNYEEAEVLKCSGDEKGNLPEEVVNIINTVLEIFYSEIKKSIDFYITSSSDDSFEKCFITGGSVQLPGIVAGLETLLGIDIEILNALEKFTYSLKNFNEQQLNSLAYTGGIALALSMRGLEND